MINKKILIVILFALLNIQAYTQEKDSIIGHYQENGADYYLLKDNSFVTIGYATLITGTWSNDNDKVTLSPMNPESSFELFGRFNPNIKNGQKIMFSHFDKQEILIGLDNSNLMQRVFNKNPNCNSFPNVYNFSVKSEIISFKEEHSKEFYTFKTGDNNDFIAIYIDPSLFFNEIILKITEKGLKNKYDEIMPRMNLTEEDLNAINPISIKSIEQPNTIAYYNPAYNEIPQSEINFEDYVYTKSKNAFINIKNYKKDEELNIDKYDYNNKNVIFNYEKISLDKKLNKKIEINEESLFIAKCKETIEAFTK